MGNWIQLRSGGGYDFDRCVINGPFDVYWDIAHPLGGLNRFVNHTVRPWDVALHSVAVARTIEEVEDDPDAAAGGLLHEAHEAVMGDIPTPVAWAIGHDKVRTLKNEIQTAIYWRLKTPPHKQTERHEIIVKTADHAALHVEKQLFMVPERDAWSVAVPEHKWMLEMYNQMRRLLMESQQMSAADIFMVEYRRLVLGEKTSIERRLATPHAS